MHPFFFGNSKRPLYGVIHNPGGSNYRNSSILLCNSVGFENMRCQRELKRLATLLSESGYYVLRFDYAGTGDSSGTFEDMGMDNWKQDIQLAKEELIAISGLPVIDCIGIRLGATMAYDALKDAGIRKMLLWDPVINGKEYLNTLDQLQDEVMNSIMWFGSPRKRDAIPENEFLGYRYSESLIKQLNRENFLEDINSPGTELIHVYSDNDDANRQLNNVLSEHKHTSERIDDMGNWDKIGSVDSSLTANKIIKRVIQEFE